MNLNGHTGDNDFKIGPTTGNFALDVASVSRSADYARFLALLANQQTAVSQERLAALEPPTVLVNPVTTVTYDTFPAIEDFDAVFSVAPVVNLNTVSGLAETDYTTRTVIDVTYTPYMNRAWLGSVGVAAGTNNAVGSGIANTVALESAVTEWGSLPRVVKSLNYATFTDWFIPSRDELVEIYNNIALFTNIDADATAGTLVSACSSSEADAPDAATKVVAVSMADGVASDVVKLNQTSAETGSTQGAVIPVRVYNSDVSVALGDVGEGTGIVFIVDLLMQTGFSGAAGTVVGTGDLIGDGIGNQTAWLAEVTEVNSHCNVVANLTFGAKTDWFIPSHDELIEIYNNLADFPVLDAAVTATEFDIVCSSSEADSPADDTDLKTVEFSTGTTTNITPKLTPTDLDASSEQGAIIPVRAIFSAAGTFAIGDTGPGGGIVFYDNGSDAAWGRYLEAIDGWYRCFEAIDETSGAWYYDLADYLTFDADERFYPAGALDVYPYDGTGAWQVYPQAGVCSYGGVGIASTLFYVDEAVLTMQARTYSTGLTASVQLVVVSSLAAP